MDAKKVMLPDTGFIRLPVVKQVTGVAGSTLWQWVREKRFPQPCKLGPRMTAWRVEDVRAWIANPYPQREGR